MPLIAKGAYVESDDKAYEVESAYYLDFQITSALVSISRLSSYKEEQEWENKCQYYHYYCDHLLYSMGQITNRFLNKYQDNNNIRQRKQYNRNNFQFTEEEFPILSDSRARNMIEHIDEYNQVIIDKNAVVGGFNTIDSETDPAIANVIRTQRETYPYTLDLINVSILIHKKSDNVTVPLDKLKKELIDLQSRVKEFNRFLSVF